VRPLVLRYVRAAGQVARVRAKNLPLRALNRGGIIRVQPVLVIGLILYKFADKTLGAKCVPRETCGPGSPRLCA